MAAPVKSQPFDIGLDGVDVLLLFLDGIGVIEAQMATGLGNSLAIPKFKQIDLAWPMCR